LLWLINRRVGMMATPERQDKPSTTAQTHPTTMITIMKMALLNCQNRPGGALA
jgi:hypothetical protein